jgi:hypothetical protein
MSTERAWAARCRLTLVVVISTCGAGACVTAAAVKRAAMVPDTPANARRNARVVSMVCNHPRGLVYSPGPGTGADIPCEEYKAAVTEAVRKSGLFTTAENAEQADLTLELSLLDLISVPGGSLTPCVPLRVQWRLLMGKDTVFLWPRTVYGRSQFGSEFVTWPTGNTLATARAARDSIREGLLALAQADLSHPLPDAELARIRREEAMRVQRIEAPVYKAPLLHRGMSLDEVSRTCDCGLVPLLVSTSARTDFYVGTALLYSSSREDSTFAFEKGVGLVGWPEGIRAMRPKGCPEQK